MSPKYICVGIILGSILIKKQLVGVLQYVFITGGFVANRWVYIGLLIVGLFSIISHAGQGPLEGISPFLIQSDRGHYVQVLNSGIGSFAKRFQMIERAERTIEVEYFIYNIDQAGRLFTQALIRKAKQGVKIRVLVDHSDPIFQLDPYHAIQLRDNGIEVKYYNTAFVLRKKAILYRNHRKLFVVDDREAIVGGRNIADEYFDLSPTYNFLDRDFYVEGTIVKSMRETFDVFWEHEKLVKSPRYWLAEEPDRNNYEDGGAHHTWKYKTSLAKKYIQETESDRQALRKVMELGGRALELEPEGICNNMVFASDRPGTGQGKNRVLFDHVMELVTNVDHTLVADSPYFILRASGNKYLSDLIQKGVDVTILTNSLNSTDAFYTVPVFRDRIKSHIQSGAKVFTYRGKPLPDQEYIDEEIREARWGVHSKTAIFDEKTVMIGTFNVDPRSARLNTELALFCENNPHLALAVKADIDKRIAQSVQLDSGGNPVDGKSPFSGAGIPKRFMYFLLSPLSHMFDSLL